MKLRYVHLQLDYETIHDKTYFSDRTYFIGHYISIQIRKLKFETDGSFKQLLVCVGKEVKPSSISLESLMVYVPFDYERYLAADDIGKCRYAIELLREGFEKARWIKAIPYERLIELSEDLVRNDYSCEWEFKKLIIREFNIRVVFTARLDTYAFTLTATVYDIKTKEILCEGLVARTKPEHLYFSYISRKMYVSDDSIIILNFTDNPSLSIKIPPLLNGKLIVNVCEPPRDHDKKEAETFRNLQSFLTYKGFDYK